MAHLKVEASVTQPERRSSVITNTFNFVFSFELERDETGAPLPPKRMLPSTGAGLGGRPGGDSGACQAEERSLGLRVLMVPLLSRHAVQSSKR